MQASIQAFLHKPKITRGGQVAVAAGLIYVAIKTHNCLMLTSKNFRVGRVPVNFFYFRVCLGAPQTSCLMYVMMEMRL